MKRPEWVWWLAVVLILLLACGLRFYRLPVQSFWNDEGNSARLSERSVALIIEGTASDIHPPLYYLALRGWRELVGASEFGLRSFSAFLGVGLTALTLALGRLWYQRRSERPIALIAAFLVAINPALIYYSQETRMYLLLPFLATLQSWLLWRWLRFERPAGPLSGIYVLVAVAGLYTHYFYPIVLLLHTLIVAANFRRHPAKRRLLGWFWLLLAALTFYIPWLPVFVRQAGGRQGLALPLIAFVQTIGEFLLLGLGNESSLWFVALPVVVLAGLGLSRRPQIGLAALVLGFLPLLALWVVGATDPAFFKFSLLVLPPLLLLMGAGFVAMWQWQPAGLAALLLLASFLWASAQALTNQTFDARYARADYRAMAGRIVAEGHPNAGVILNAANQWEVFTYYFPAMTPVYPLPRGAMAPDRLERELAELTARHDRLYALFWGEGGRDPERIVERYLDQYTFKAVDQWYGDVRFVMYAVPPASDVNLAPLPLPAGGLTFANQIVLLAAKAPAAPVQAGDIIPIQLEWLTLTGLNERYKVFLHLVDSSGQLAAQRDSEPGGGLALTTTWTPGKVVADNHGIFLPLELPAGQYTVRLGLYDLLDPSRRLLLPDGADWWDLLTIQVDSPS